MVYKYQVFSTCCVGPWVWWPLDTHGFHTSSETFKCLHGLSLPTYLHPAWSGRGHILSNIYSCHHPRMLSPLTSLTELGSSLHRIHSIPRTSSPLHTCHGQKRHSRTVPSPSRQCSHISRCFSRVITTGL